MKRLTLQIITATILLTSILMPLSAAASVGDVVTNLVAGATGVTSMVQGANALMEDIVLPVAGSILWVTGQMLDLTITISLSIAALASGASSAIILGWTIVRDVFNMMFIFVIIWVAIATMLDISKWSAKQMLTKIIIAAILINFSFFITEVIIDAGNIFGAWFYNGIVQTFIRAGTGGTSISDVSLSAGLSTALGAYSLYTPGGSGGFWSMFSFGTATNDFIGAFIRLGVIAFSSYIFAYVSILFFARTVSLLFSLVLSPVGFVGSILPQTQEYAKEWWDELIKNVLLAPIFLLFLYIITAFVNTPIFANAGIGGGIGGGVASNGFDPMAFFKYFLLAAMLLYALKASKKHSGAIGKALGKMANQVGQLAAGVAVGVATGGAGLALSSTVGAVGARVAESDTVKGMIGSKNRVVSVLGSSLRGTGTWTSKQSFDTSKAVSGAFGVDIPKMMQSNKEGYAGRQKARAKTVEENAKLIGPSKEQTDLVEQKTREKEAGYNREIREKEEEEENQESILQSTKNNLGENSPEYKASEKTLADIRAEKAIIKEKRSKVPEEVLKEEGEKDPNLRRGLHKT